ncbi:hypothetical protein [Nocardia jinanensis]|uniref:Uncharacterized protein n=1 Tax=Nocardia jinanensis TaxID=382504 RepID=A0A917R524_9NOCA|nr:hypothetical protein [Nocardia jinanensis]GGK90729.1 hypothetical protein GCM10011588_01220 [Nocardia jinanensis]
MTHSDTARARAGRAARVRADHPPATVAGAGSEGDPLVAAVRRIRSFLWEGWRFQAGLAARAPHLFLSGWSW